MSRRQSPKDSSKYEVTFPGNCGVPIPLILSGVYVSKEALVASHLLNITALVIPSMLNQYCRFLLHSPTLPSMARLIALTCSLWVCKWFPLSRQFSRIFLPERHLRHRCWLDASCCCGSPPSPARLSAVQPFIWCQLRQMKLNLALPARWILWRLRGVYLIQIGQDGVYLLRQTNSYVVWIERFNTKCPKIAVFWHINTTPHFLPQLKWLTLGNFLKSQLGFSFSVNGFITLQVSQVTQNSEIRCHYSAFIFHILCTVGRCEVMESQSKDELYIQVFSLRKRLFFGVCV